MKLTNKQVADIAVKAHDLHWRDYAPDVATMRKVVRLIAREIEKLRGTNAN